MQPPTPSSNPSKPTAAAHATGQVQLELADNEDSPDGGDKPASNNHHHKSTSRPAAPQSVKPVAAAAATMTEQPLTAPKLTAANSLKRMFRSGESTPRSVSATPQGNVHATSGAVAASETELSAGSAVAHHHASSASPLLTATHIHHHDKSLAHRTGASPTAAMHWHNNTPSTSISPTSTLPTPPSEPNDSSPPHSRANSRPGSRKSSFSGSTAAKPSSIAGSEHGASSHGGQRFTLKDLLASGGPKLARRPSNSSRKSDISSERGGAAATTAGESTTSLLKKYGVCEKVAIGKGATSVVRLAHKWDRSEEKLYAVKEFRKRRKNETEKEYIKKLTAEFCISSTLHHINIVETVDLVQDEAHHWCEVMEYCPGGDLYAAIKKGQMTPSEIECCFKQLLTGVEYLHAQGVAHRDIKPENLFFDTRGHLKIGDYGASTVYRLPWEATVHMSTGLCGSEPYIAPEQFQRKPYDARLVDIWAVGIVYYCLMFQELPWRVAQPSDPLFAAYQQACAAAPFKSSVGSNSSKDAAAAPPKSTTSSTSSFHSHPHSSNNSNNFTFPPTINMVEPREARPLLRRILEPDPKLRANISEILSNPWMKEIEVCTLVKQPRHMHSNIRSALGQSVVPLGSPEI